MKTTADHIHKAVDFAVNEVQEELMRASAKHPAWPNDPIHQWAIVQEEVGETQKEVLQLVYETPMEARCYQKAKIREEAVQTAAMCLRFLAHLDDIG